MAEARMRRLRIVAQDPSFKDAKGRILTAEIDVPYEELAPGPWGHRVHVIDFDASTNTHFKALKLEADGSDPYRRASDRTLLTDPRFHAQNVYAVAMRILCRFEHALGRRIGWKFNNHQIKVSPHAFADANAFYSRDDEALLFGYFAARDGGGSIFTCLSHDVVAHETSHALLDGLRERYADPAHLDQAAFHEGFSDAIALLSVFALPEVVAGVLAVHGKQGLGSSRARRLVAASSVTVEALKACALLGLAEEMGDEVQAVRGAALRRSIELDPADVRRHPARYQEPHVRGEVLVAAIMGAFLDVWVDRIDALRRYDGDLVDVDRVAEEGALVADEMFTMVIRAIDYAPPVHLTFGDYLSALLTADMEIRPDQRSFPFRQRLRERFALFGIAPASASQTGEPGTWRSAEEDLAGQLPRYEGVHFESLKSDPEEVFRFLWQNRALLRLQDGAFTRVLSVRPVMRVGRDGFVLRETVAEYVQQLTLLASELSQWKIVKPAAMPADQEVSLHGGGVLIFDEFGRLKYHIHNALNRPGAQTERLASMWRFGSYSRESRSSRRLARIHLQRSIGAPAIPDWA